MILRALTRGLGLKNSVLAAKPAASPERLTTLLVDDDEFVLQALPSFLARVPEIEVIGTAKNGLEALAMVKLKQPKMVLMDVRMPRMGGIEAAGIMRREYPDMRVVLTSGMDDPEMRAECLACGAHGFMAKLEVITQFPKLIQMMFAK